MKLYTIYSNKYQIKPASLHNPLVTGAFQVAAGFPPRRIAEAIACDGTQPKWLRLHLAAPGST
jgi:hypothetical protein